MDDDASLHILMVDDDREDAFLMRRAIAKLKEPVRFDHELDSTKFVDALADPKHMSSALADIILLDLNMPRINGFELLKRLRGNTKFDSAQVIMLTTSESHEDKEKALGLGADRFVSKPSTMEGLQQFAESLLASA